jgi:hypothetical protein
VITGIRGEVDITTGNWPSGWQWFAPDWLFLAIRETLTGKHKTDDCGQTQRVHR